MTNPTAAARETAGTAHGTVFDIGYQRYEGPREGRGRARLAVFRDGVRAALGFGRGGKAKILPWTFIGAMVAVGFILALVAGFVLRVAGPEAVDEIPSHSDFYGIASMFYLVFAAVVAPELLCPDRRNRVIDLYLVRPITGADYVAARWLAFLSVALFAAWLPQLVLLAGRVMGSPDPVVYLRESWLDIPRLLAAGGAIAVFTTTLALLVAAFTTRRAYAAVFLVGLFVITAPFTIGLSQEIDGAAGQWISMFTLSNIPVHVNDLIFGQVSAMTAGAPARELPAGVLVGWFFAWVLIPGGVLWARYRRLAP